MFLRFQVFFPVFSLCYLIFFVSPGRIPINRLCNKDRKGICIDIWKCPYYIDLLNQRAPPYPLPVIQDIRRNMCGFASKDVPEVCCVIPTTTEIPTIDERQASVQHKNMELLPRISCGQIPNDFRITKGTETVPGEFPWMALIAYEIDDSLDFRCGGSLINEQYILTAAHCIDSVAIVGVRLGEHNLLRDRDCDSHSCQPPVEDLQISKITVHPLYEPNTYINDIALIKLKNKVQFQPHIQPVCLPFDPSLRTDLSGKEAIVTGWGVTEIGDKSAVLLKVSIPVRPIQECQKMYRSFKPITRNQICAGGYKGRDSCAGDSGGPMVYVGNIGDSSRYVQYGIVSYGPRFCGLDGRPGIYTKVTEYVDWILDNLDA